MFQTRSTYLQADSFFILECDVLVANVHVEHLSQLDSYVLQCSECVHQAMVEFTFFHCALVHVPELFSIVVQFGDQLFNLDQVFPQSFPQLVPVFGTFGTLVVFLQQVYEKVNQKCLNLH